MINWKHILNIQGSFNEDLRTITSILFVMFSLQFTLQLIYSIFLGIQEPARVSFFNMLSNVFVLAAIMLLIRYEKESLLHLTMIFSVIPVLVIFCVNFIYFRKSFKKFSPTLTYFKFDVLKDVLSLGVKFFVIQITVLVFYETTNLLICRFLSLIHNFRETCCSEQCVAPVQLNSPYHYAERALLMPTGICKHIVQLGCFSHSNSS